MLHEPFIFEVYTAEKTPKYSHSKILLLVKQSDIMSEHESERFSASLISSVDSMVAPLTGLYWFRIPVGLALHVLSPHPRVCKL